MVKSFNNHPTNWPLGPSGCLRPIEGGRIDDLVAEIKARTERDERKVFITIAKNGL